MVGGRKTHFAITALFRRGGNLLRITGGLSRLNSPSYLTYGPTYQAFMRLRRLNSRFYATPTFLVTR